MSEAEAPLPTPGRAALGPALLRLALFALIFLACVHLGGLATGHFWPAGGGPRGRAAQVLAGSALGELVAILLLLVWLARTGRGVAWAGLAKGASIKTWIAALVIAALWIGLLWLGPLHRVGDFTELSSWRVSLALMAGCVAGFGEELMFRGVTIESLAEARAPLWMQLLAGSLLFGLAHLGWASLSGNLAAGLSAAASTAVMGFALSILYVAGGRRLWPCIVAHGLIDLCIEPWLALAAIQHFQ
jgi:hypothetical protein